MIRGRRWMTALAAAGALAVAACGGSGASSGNQVITPNPFTSGGARWNVMAAYGAASDKGKNPDAGTAYLNALFKNVAVQDSSARAQLQTFVGGKGDAMIDYENDAIFAQQNG